MKKILLVSMLALAITSSLVAGTLATYTKTTTPIEATVTAKSFNLISKADIEPEIKLAPGEKTEWEFTVENFEGEIVTETAMDLSINLLVDSVVDKEAISGLKVEVYEGEIPLGEAITKNGEIEIKLDRAFKANEKSTRTFKLKLNWENGVAGDGVDTIDATNQNATKIKVNVTGTQSSKYPENKEITLLENGIEARYVANYNSSNNRVYMNINGKQIFRTNGDGDNGKLVDMFIMNNEPYVLVQHWKKGTMILADANEGSIAAKQCGTYNSTNQKSIINGSYTAEQVGANIIVKNNGQTLYEINSEELNGGLRSLIINDNKAYVVVKHRSKGVIAVGEDGQHSTLGIN